jgi:hypothetical protein
LIRSKLLPISALLVGTALALSRPLLAADPAAQALKDQYRAVRGDVIAKRDSALQTLIKLDEGQAKAFWPLKAQYDAELKKIGEAREALLKEYAKVYKAPSPAQATDLATRSLKLDDDRNALRRKYFDLMSEKVSPLAAGQFLQLERQFETMMDFKAQAIIPLAGE